MPQVISRKIRVSENVSYAQCHTVLAINEIFRQNKAS